MTKNWFTLIIKRKHLCSICQLENEFELQDNHLNIYPEKQIDITVLLNESFNSHITKICNICLCNTMHHEKTCIEQNPNILVLVVNRYAFGSHASKNNDCILINRRLHINTMFYDLICSIHHLGISPTSGHYISKLYYQNGIYECNDHKISGLTCDVELSKSAYIIFYKTV